MGMNNFNTQIYDQQIRTATPTAETLTNSGHKGIHVIIDVTAGVILDIDPTIVAIDEVSGKTYTLLAGAKITGVGTVVLRVHPDLTAVTNLTAKDNLPSKFQVVMTHNNSTQATYTVAANYVM